MVLVPRGGSVVTYTYAYDIWGPDTPEGQEKLALRRFRMIDGAASEEVSVGWCTFADPSGGSFDGEDTSAGNASWVCMRIDRKVLPKKLVAMHLAAAARAKGKALTAKERRELKDSLAQQMLPRVLPTTVMYHVMIWPSTRRVALVGGGKSARDAFAKLFFETFGVALERLSPGELALELLGEEHRKTLAVLEPTRWPVARGGE